LIKSILLKFGRALGLPPERTAVEPITVFVGPNNSGKSLVLSEIAQLCRTGSRSSTTLVLDDLEFQGLDANEAVDAIKQIVLAPNPGEAVNVGHVLIGTHANRQQIHWGSILQYVQNPASNLGAFCQWFLTYKTLMLDGRNRINLVNQQSAGDMQGPPSSSFQVLFRDDQKRAEVRRIGLDAFGTHFVIDPTNLGQLRLRFSNRAPIDRMEERGIHEAAVAFHAAAKLIDYASDGVKAFTGIVTEVMAGDPRVLLIDEPEAFLHPALAFKLALEISQAALSSDKRLFVSTHSPNFVMGCIQSGAPVNIIRLTFRNDVATARVLPSAEILELMRNPLLRSTGVLSGLFYEFVVVTESDADRAFYQEVNERLLRFKPEWGIPNCLFLNAQNKQTVPTILRPLRKLGIPAVGIVDVDILKEGGTVWSNLMRGAFIPELSHQPMASQRAAIKNAMDNTGKNMKRDGGLAILPPGEKEAGTDLFEQLGSYGVFAVPGGELESWLKPLGATGHGPEWLVTIFERMGEDPSDSQYVRPDGGDVWEFLGRVRTWLLDPARKGIPL
jgi:predicted ATPase